MNNDFARAMSRATASLRTQNVSEATALIQAALALRPDQRSEHGGTTAPAPRPFRVAAEVEDAETLDAQPAAPRPAAGGRRPLREVVDLLRSGRLAFDGLDLPPPAGRRRPTAPSLPDGASFEWRTHTCAAGSRRYRLFVPACPRSELKGLVLMLHGCKQNPDDFAAGTDMNRLAQEAGMVVAYPEQPTGANMSGCWNWFEPAHQNRGAGEPAILAALARDLTAEFGLPADRVYAAGLSAGGAMAAVLAETHPDVFAAVGIHSGLPHGSARDVVSAFAAMRGQGLPAAQRATGGPRVIVFHGTADRTVDAANALAIVGGLAPDSPAATGTTAGRSWRLRRQEIDNVPQVELWLVDGVGHAWSGGNASGSYTDASGPSASAEMLRFFAAATPPF